jgi:hypothetical protein
VTIRCVAKIIFLHENVKKVNFIFFFSTGPVPYWYILRGPARVCRTLRDVVAVVIQSSAYTRLRETIMRLIGLCPVKCETAVCGGQRYGRLAALPIRCRFRRYRTISGLEQKMSAVCR